MAQKIRVHFADGQVYESQWNYYQNGMFDPDVEDQEWFNPEISTFVSDYDYDSGKVIVVHNVSRINYIEFLESDNGIDP